MLSITHFTFRAFLWLLAGFILVAILGMGMIAWDLRGIDWRSVDLGPSEAAIELVAADGSEIRWDGERRGAPVAAGAIPPLVANAIVAIEDRRFYRHFGVDPLGIGRAAISNWRHGHVVEGGSTITQQYARLRFLGQERTYRRKLREIAIALWLERAHEKNEILAAYLNEVYFGSGAYGISAAAASFFGKHPRDLTLGEAAILAGAVNAPSQINPDADPQAAAQRAGKVLEIMVETGTASGQEAATALAQVTELVTRRQRPASATEPSWFGDWVHAQTVAATRAAPREAAIRATTTLDPSLQALAEKVVRDVIGKDGKKLRASQAALVAMRPDGAVLALAGGVDYRANRFNRATQARRQPGSLFKLFVYYAAIRNGWRPDHTVMDEPMEIDGWEPGNFDNRFKGEMTLQMAFASSRNIPAVQLAMDVGMEEVETAARDLGIESPLRISPSLALGASEVTLLEITGAFASVRAGRKVRPWAISRIAFQDDAPAISLAPPADPHVIGEHRKALLALLRAAVVSGTGREAAMERHFVAGKTGTSQGHRDAWFVGFTEDLVVGVWVGNDDNSPMKGVTGGGLPARIWKQFVSRAEVPEMAIRVASLTPVEAFPDKEEVEFGDETEIAQAACNISACSSRYRSFRASDCTFQPFEGPRRLCTATSASNRNADSERRQIAAATISTRRSKARGGSCNISACAARYRSFRASDCTYQPHNGPRQFCTAGGRGGADHGHGAASNVTAYVREEPVRRVYRVPAPSLFDRIFLPRRVDRHRVVIQEGRGWR